MARDITKLRGEMAIAADAMERATENWRRETMREIARLRAALETAERRRAETAAGAKREFDRMRNERDEARTEAEALLSHIQRVASGEAYAGMLFSLPWVDHSKGADDGE